MSRFYKYSFTLLLIFNFLNSCSNKNEGKPIIQDIEELIFASGKLEWDNSYNLTAQTDGILTEANFDIGNHFTKGQILAKITNEINETNTQTAKDQLSISQENLTIKSPALQQLRENIEFAETKSVHDENQAKRFQKLYETNAISKVENENMKLVSSNSLANLNSLKKQYLQILQQAKQQEIVSKGQFKNNQIIQNYQNIFVLEKGTVIKKWKTTGDYVKKGDVIATIADENKTEIILNVDENSIGKVRLNQAVFVKFNTTKSKIYKGSISEILSSYDEQSQSFICKVKLNDKLSNSIYGTQLEANILVNKKNKALLIPRKYLNYGNKVKIKDKKEAVKIVTGIISTEYVEVLNGINENDILEIQNP